MKKNFFGLLWVSCLLLFSNTVFADKSVISTRVEQAPVIDGSADDASWSKSESVVTFDAVAGIDIEIRSVYSDDKIFFLIRFPDDTENRQHKLLHWDADKKLYQVGPEREDVFVFKWNMEPFPMDITLSASAPYKADVWYWKSVRTDHAGFADDKFHIFSDVQVPKSNTIIGSDGRSYYLRRKGDKGRAAYKTTIPISYQGETDSGFEFIQPQGSRADISARGKWQNNVWTLEVSRKLQTNQADDIQLDTRMNYRFGISRYEIAGRPADDTLEIPLYGSGEISEHLRLQFR